MQLGSVEVRLTGSSPFSRVDRKRGRRHSTRWLDLRVEAVIERAIQTFYLSPERPGMIALLFRTEPRSSFSILD